MTIRQRFEECSDESTKKFWRGLILRNYSLLMCHQWFSVMENPRMGIKCGDEVVDDGKPIENIRWEDIYKMVFSLNPMVATRAVELNNFFDWFLDLDVEAYEEETEEDYINFLDFKFMGKAFNDYIAKEAVFK